MGNDNTYEVWYATNGKPRVWISIGSNIISDGFINNNNMIPVRYFIFIDQTRIEMSSESFCFRFSPERNTIIENLNAKENKNEE